MPHTLDSAIKGQIKNLFHEFMTEYLLPKIDQPQIQLIETSRTEASKIGKLSKLYVQKEKALQMMF
jgi:hypothetical protein